MHFCVCLFRGLRPIHGDAGTIAGPEHPTLLRFADVPGQAIFDQSGRAIGFAGPINLTSEFHRHAMRYPVARRPERPLRRFNVAGEIPESFIQCPPTSAFAGSKSTRPWLVTSAEPSTG
jgi:hypothetical protein